MQQSIKLSKTGIDEIDRQHAQLVKCLDDLLKYVETSYSDSACLTTIVTLMDYTKAHFADEEKLLAECGYPLLDQHIAEHQIIKDDVMRLWADIEAGGKIGQALVHTVRRWIVDHINSEDMAFAEFVASRS